MKNDWEATATKALESCKTKIIESLKHADSSDPNAIYELLKAIQSLPDPNQWHQSGKKR